MVASAKDSDKPNSQKDLLKEFFIANPNRDISHPEVVDWATEEWRRRMGDVFRDPDRGIRSLHQQGFLQKICKGVYRYDPDLVQNRELEDFTAGQKEEILKRDGYKCVVCGSGKKEGLDLHVDHIKPKDRGGKATLENGQVLCAPHNFIKKNSGGTETGKKMLIRLYELANKENDETLRNFFIDALQVYEDHDINGHIEWKK